MLYADAFKRSIKSEAIYYLVAKVLRSLSDGKPRLPMWDRIAL